MTEFNLTILLASIIATAAPVVLAVLGEVLTERAGVINLSLDGTILLSAMTAFVVACETNSLLLGFLAAALVGAIVAATVAVFSVYFGRSQVAVGFVLTLMTRDLAYFLGNPYSRIHGPQMIIQPVPVLSQIPVIGPIFFNQHLPVYLSLLLIVICCWYVYSTPMGLQLRSVGENPLAAFARGIAPQRLQLVYTICGGMLVGLAGAAFSLAVKPGWGRPQGAEGTGWIALALVIFGGWNPLKAAIGAYLFALLQILGIYFQGWLPSVPAQVFQVAPFRMMIFILVLMNLFQKESLLLWAGRSLWKKTILRIFFTNAPASLGKSYRTD